MMIAAFVVVAVMAGQAPEVRDDIAAQVKQCEALVGEFEEQKALDTLDGLAARSDLTPTELGLVQLWRGVALMSLYKEPEANTAFGISRACAPLMEVPASVSPKIRKAITGSVPGDCPVQAQAAQDPEAAVAAAPPATKSPGSEGSASTTSASPAPASEGAEGEGGGKGISPLTIGGAGVAGLGGALLVLAIVAGVGGVALLGSSFPVLAQAQAAERAADARQMATVALGLRLGGGGLAVLTLVGLVAALAGVGGGIALAVAGFMM